MVDNAFPIFFPVSSILFNPQNLTPLILFCLPCSSFCCHCEMWVLFLRGPSFMHTTIYDNTKIQEECSGSKREEAHGHVHSKHEG